jgi:cytochrome c6
MRIVISLIFVVSLVLVLSRCGGNEETPEKEEISGETVYKQQCMLCHGSNGDLGVSGASPLSLSKLDLKKRIEVIKDGRGKMQAFTGFLTEEEIQAVAEYLETLKK